MMSTAQADVYMTGSNQTGPGALTGRDFLSGADHPLSGGSLTLVVAPSEWRSDASIAIKELLLLSEDWDAEGARAVSQRAVEHAMKLLEPLLDEVPSLRRPAIYPSTDGGVVLDWELDRNHLDLEVTPGGVVEVFYALADGPTWGGEVGGEPMPLNELLRLFI